MSNFILFSYWALCFVITHLPPGNIPPTIQGIDKLIHLVGYFLLGWLLTAFKHSSIFSALKILAVLLIYAFLDEATQPLVGRSFDLLDIGADLTGATLGVWASLKIFPRR